MKVLQHVFRIGALSLLTCFLLGVSGEAQTIIYQENFDHGQDSWFADNGVWEIGRPIVGPIKTHSDTGVAGTLLKENYKPSTRSRLISPKIKLPDVVVPEKLTYSLWQWFKINQDDVAGPDSGFIQISRDGKTWQNLQPGFITGQSPAWTQSVFDLTAFKNSNIYLGFLFSPTHRGEDKGWYIDDIVIKRTGAISPSTGFYDDFELGVDDWSADIGVWEIGKPTVGPPSAHSGEIVAATFLAENYKPLNKSRLISRKILLPNPGDDDKILLSFWHWFRINEDDVAGPDSGFVQISVDGVAWKTLPETAVSGLSPAWTQLVVDLTKYRNQMVQIGFLFKATHRGEDNGWYIDDVNIHTSAFEFRCIGGKYFEAFESGDDDWSASNGVWQIGTPRTCVPSTHSGTNCAGTFLDSNYQPLCNSCLISPDVILTPIPDETPFLYFWHWFKINNTDVAGPDYGTVKIRKKGDSWEQIFGPVSGSSPAWSQVGIDLSAWTNSTIQIAFCFTSTPRSEDCGWYIDDIRFEGVTCGCQLTAKDIGSFGDVLIGTSRTQKTYLHNNGTQPLTITSISLAGENSDAFSFSPKSPFTVPGNDSISLNVTFTPRTARSYEAAMTIVSEAYTLTLPLTGTGLGIPKIRISPEYLNFGAITIGSRSCADLRIKNIGTAALQVGPFKLTGPDADQFEIDQSNFALQPNDSTKVSVCLKPHKVSMANAILELYNNDTLIKIPLAGIGIVIGINPFIKNITDIPNDQGKQVLVRWLHSRLDSSASRDTVITGYSLWRRVDHMVMSKQDESAASASLFRDQAPSTGAGLEAFHALVPSLAKPVAEKVDEASLSFVLIDDGELWTFMALAPALQQYHYSLVAPTLYDSTKDGKVNSIFKVFAHTKDPKIWFASNPDSGYSIDNLAPHTPDNLYCVSKPGVIQLTWDENQDPDIQCYTIYRTFGNNQKSVKVTQPSYNDPIQQSGVYYYRVSATDFSGNESDKAIPNPAATTSVTSMALQIPVSLQLEQNFPNPFNPTTSIVVHLPNHEMVTLEILNTLGQSIRMLVQESRVAGIYQVSWDARDDRGHPVPSGVYLCRLTAGNQVLVRKMLYMR